MKHFLLLFLGLMVSAPAVAEKYPWIYITQTDPVTTTLFDKYGQMAGLYDGEDLHVGIINTSIILICPSIPEDAEPLSEVYADIRYTDMYGRIQYGKVDSTVLQSFSEKLSIMESDSTRLGFSLNIQRGGRYTYRNYLPGIGYDYSKVVDIIDEPTVTLYGNDIKIGQNFTLKACFNTGYPFNPEQFNTTEPAVMTLYSVTKDNNDSPVLTQLAQVSNALNLYNAEEPLIAALDTLWMKYDQPAPGKYELRLNTTCPFENMYKTFELSVCDTLRSTASFDKSQYSTTDKQAVLTVSADYGYPHISIPEGAEKPKFSVQLILSNLQQEEGTNELKRVVLDKFEQSIEHDSLATKDLKENMEFKFMIDEISKSRKFTAEDPLFVDVVIKFNGVAKHHHELTFYFDDATSELKQIQASSEENEIYDILGRKLSGRTLTRGIYIKNNKKIIVK